MSPTTRATGSGWRRHGALALAALALALLGLVASSFQGSLAARADAARPLDIGFADTLYEQPQTSLRWLRTTRSVNADFVRVNMYWSLVALNEPANPRDPTDPAYNWALYDTIVNNAVKEGFKVDLTVLAAPYWAEGKNRPSPKKAPYGSWKPNARDFGDFAHALAKRYSGDFKSGGTTLPRLRYFEAWNEPNLGTYITPQFKGKRNKSVQIYRKLLDHFYKGIKGVMPKAKIVTGGTAPYGDDPGKRAKKTTPVQFARELLCLNRKLRRAKCKQKAKFDIYAHHPINRTDPPTKHADHSGDVEVADFNSLTKIVRKAEKLHTVGNKGRHKLWANEVWWQTNPPDKAEGVPLKTQARWMQQSLYLLWKQGASNVSFLQFRDAKYKRGEFTLDSYQTGVYTYKGKPKPSAHAIAFPFVTDRKGKGGKLLAWGKSPRSGKLTIEAKPKGRGGGFHKVRKIRVKAGKVFTTKVNVRGKAKLRARVGKRKSLVWAQK